MLVCKSKQYNLIFIDCNYFLSSISHSISTLVEVDKLSKTDYKKLVLHYFLSELLSVSKRKTHKEKPVYCFTTTFLKTLDEVYLNTLIAVIKKLKKILPLPILIIEEYKVLTNKNGEYKEVCEKISNFYTTRKIQTRKLKKYLELEEYYELIKVFNNVNNIKSILV